MYVRPRDDKSGALFLNDYAYVMLTIVPKPASASWEGWGPDAIVSSGMFRLLQLFTT